MLPRFCYSKHEVVKVVKVILVKMILCLSNGLTIIINIYIYIIVEVFLTWRTTLTK